MTVNFPNVKIKNSEFGLSFNVQEFSSPYNQSSQIIRLPGERWMASYEFPPMSQAQFTALKIFLLGQQGGSNTFWGFDPDRKVPQGVASGTPLVDGDNQTGKTLNTKGWTPNTTNILKAGDYIQFGAQLRLVMADADSNSDGKATLRLDSPMRISPSDNTTIITNQASCPMRITSDTKWQSDNRGIITFSMTCIEVFS